jgi:hypothetical protein
MGEVYEAVDSALGEVVALKTLAVTAVDKADAVKRLLAEVRIARKVTHPNVCRILEFGTHLRAGSMDQPVPFLTMPLLQGETLGRRIERQGRLPPREALRILADLAAGLTAVHEVGVVHRDFKSDNAFLVKGDDGKERAVVMDFGLARALEARGDGKKSTEGLLLGTPAYMAPEQVEGKTITKAVDVYALGVVAFELITGRVPFVAESAAAVALARLQRGAVPPSSIVAGLDRAWDVIIQRCLKRAPEQRYPSMTEVTGAFDRLRERRPRRRRPWHTASAVTFALAMVAFAAWTVVSSARPRSALVPATIAVNSAPPAGAIAPAAPAPSVVGAGVAPTPAPSPSRESGKDAALVAHLRAMKRERPVFGAMLDSRSPISSPSPAPTPPSSQKPAESAQPEDTPFVRPSVPRPRQADDLVNPF